MKNSYKQNENLQNDNQFDRNLLLSKDYQREIDERNVLSDEMKDVINQVDEKIRKVEALKDSPTFDEHKVFGKLKIYLKKKISTLKTSFSAYKSTVKKKAASSLVLASLVAIIASTSGCMAMENSSIASSTANGQTTEYAQYVDQSEYERLTAELASAQSNLKESEERRQNIETELAEIKAKQENEENKLSSISDELEQSRKRVEELEKEQKENDNLIDQLEKEKQIAIAQSDIEKAKTIEAEQALAEENAKRIEAEKFAEEKKLEANKIAEDLAKEEEEQRLAKEAQKIAELNLENEKTAREQAEQAQKTAEDAQRVAELNLENEKIAREQAEQAQRNAEEAQRVAKEAQKDAEEAQRIAEEAQKGAESDLAEEKLAREQAEQARIVAEQAQKDAEEAQLIAQQQQKDAEEAQIAAEQAQKIAEEAQIAAEEAQIAAEEAQKVAESDLETEKRAREQAEQAQKNAEEEVEEAQQQAKELQAKIERLQTEIDRLQAEIEDYESAEVQNASPVAQSSEKEIYQNFMKAVIPRLKNRLDTYGGGTLQKINYITNVEGGLCIDIEAYDGEDYSERSFLFKGLYVNSIEDLETFAQTIASTSTFPNYKVFPYRIYTYWGCEKEIIQELKYRDFIGATEELLTMHCTQPANQGGSDVELCLQAANGDMFIQKVHICSTGDDFLANLRYTTYIDDGITKLDDIAETFNKLQDKYGSEELSK